MTWLWLFYFPKAEAQSALNFSRPASVNGCLTICITKAYGTVAICAPALAASVTWIGCLTLAAIISVVIPCISKISAIVLTSYIPSIDISSILPKNGLT